MDLFEYMPKSPPEANASKTLSLGFIASVLSKLMKYRRKNGAALISNVEPNACVHKLTKSSEIVTFHLHKNKT